jgi:hypothetical protein
VSGNRPRNRKRRNFPPFPPAARRYPLTVSKSDVHPSATAAPPGHKNFCGSPRRRGFSSARSSMLDLFPRGCDPVTSTSPATSRSTGQLQRLSHRGSANRSANALPRTTRRRTGSMLPAWSWCTACIIWASTSRAWSPSLAPCLRAASAY